MIATLHDFGKRGIVVMDGKRTVAKGRPVHNRGVWMLTIYDGSWADTMRNTAQAERYARFGLKPNIAPWLKTVKTRREALRILSDMAKSYQGAFVGA